jgi:hypothetical protein
MEDLRRFLSGEELPRIRVCVWEDSMQCPEHHYKGERNVIRESGSVRANQRRRQQAASTAWTQHSRTLLAIIFRTEGASVEAVGDIEYILPFQCVLGVPKRKWNPGLWTLASHFVPPDAHPAVGNINGCHLRNLCSFGKCHAVWEPSSHSPVFRGK